MRPAIQCNMAMTLATPGSGLRPGVRNRGSGVGRSGGSSRLSDGGRGMIRNFPGGCRTGASSAKSLQFLRRSAAKSATFSPFLPRSARRARKMAGFEFSKSRNSRLFLRISASKSREIREGAHALLRRNFGDLPKERSSERCCPPANRLAGRADGANSEIRSHPRTGPAELAPTDASARIIAHNVRPPLSTS